MKSTEAENALRCLAATQGLDISALDARAAVGLIADFYREQRAEDCDMDADGDMLLFEWGVSPWGGESFRVSITRQLIARGADDDDILQLKLTVHYEPDEETRLASAEAKRSRTSNHWCGSLTALQGFRRFIDSSIALSLADVRQPTRVALNYGVVG